MICRVVCYMLIMLFIDCGCFASWADESIIKVLDEARCVHFAFDPIEGGWFSMLNPEDMSDAWNAYTPIYSQDKFNGKKYWKRSAEYRVMLNTSLALVDSVRISGTAFHDWENSSQIEYTLELYKGDTDDYLVIARIDDTIYCMQYINSDDSNAYYDDEVLSQNVYAHYCQGTGVDSGSIYDYASYFLDGTCVDLTFYDSTDKLYYKEHRTGEDMLIKYFDICTYDEGFTDDFAMASK